MNDFKIDHGIFKPLDSITVNDADKLQRKIHIGEKYRYPMMVKGPDGETIERWEKVKVTGIYPHLVTVSGQGSEYPLKTITYFDILTDGRYTLNV